MNIPVTFCLAQSSHRRDSPTWHVCCSLPSGKRRTWHVLEGQAGWADFKRGQGIEGRPAKEGAVENTVMQSLRLLNYQCDVRSMIGPGTKINLS